MLLRHFKTFSAMFLADFSCDVKVFKPSLGLTGFKGLKEISTKSSEAAPRGTTRAPALARSSGKGRSELPKSSPSQILAWPMKDRLGLCILDLEHVRNM